jgi:hypothetical protein
MCSGVQLPRRTAIPDALTTVETWFDAIIVGEKKA